MQKIRASCNNCNKILILPYFSIINLCKECKEKEKQEMATFLAKNKDTI